MDYIKNELYQFIAHTVILFSFAVPIVFVLQACTTKPKSKIYIKAHDFHKPTQSAVDIWNGYVGCDFLSVHAGKGGLDAHIFVISDNGEPCGDPWRPQEEWGHDATAYRCDLRRTELVVSRPGDTHTQTCIIAHELGHALGRPHQSHGAMSNKCGDRISISDSDTKALKKKYCQ